MKVHRAWHFHGYATLDAREDAELVALHVTHHERDGFGFWFLDEHGERIDTSTELVRADASGAPLDRFGGSVYAPDGAADLVIIGAVVKGTRKMKLGLRDGTRMFATPYCAIDVDVVDGPAWPAKPEIDVVRVAMSGPKRVLALVRLKNLLPEEWPAPQLQVSENEERTKLLRADARALASANARGEPTATSPRTAERFLVAEYDWDHDSAPHEWVSWVSQARELPPAVSWRASPALRAALDENVALSEVQGRRAAAIAVYGATALEDGGAPSRGTRTPPHLDQKKQPCSRSTQQPEPQVPCAREDHRVVNE
jgi:hypothetical protein